MRIDWMTAVSTGVGLLLAAALPAQGSEQIASKLEKPVRLEAGGEPIDTSKDIGHAGPMLVDHDGDGLSDLLVSSFRGNIRFFKNVGTRREPKFVEKDQLKAGGEPIRIHNW